MPAWFLTPRLKSAVFLLNTPTEGVEGAIGVSPDVFIVDSAGFAEAFSAEWGGDQPFETTYTMFDAGALLLLSIDAAARRDEPLDRAHIEERLFDIARPGGVQLGWQELDQAVGWNRDGATIQYTGVTGPILLDADGQRRGGRTLVWTIQGGQIVNR